MTHGPQTHRRPDRARYRTLQAQNHAQPQLRPSEPELPENLYFKDSSEVAEVVGPALGCSRNGISSAY